MSDFVGPASSTAYALDGSNTIEFAAGYSFGFTPDEYGYYAYIIVSS